MLTLKNTFITATLIGSLFSAASQADIIISGTRIVYDADKKDVSVRLENKGTRPLLVQNWIDLGDDNADPGSIKAPFISSPPVSRIEPKRGQSVKITFTRASTLPKDRESVFWFNVLEVPPKADTSKAENKNLLQLAFRTRIKLFYRPASLPGTQSEAVKQLKWQMTKEQGQTVVRADNPTPYYISFNDATLTASGKHYDVSATMVAPFGNAAFVVKGGQSLSSGKLDYHAINDFGGMIAGSVSL
ncbi:fimbrial chaperone [Salmonella enterica]|nr:fimbrial chaperone [Salmonella enterica]ECI5354309.1 fimbrial chaperone [Salmonella enterica subsp. enterica]EDU6364224.1 fimbrial chaperone [Salmonella enterica subsp. enterica serovar Florian]EAX6603957.1 fimbrial chaperone [Salmonella enterica]EEJ8589924.1 fimbrial chaperone [Salmonella enterica subsp. enterica]